MIALIPHARQIVKVSDLIGDCVEVCFFENFDDLKREIKNNVINVDSDTRIVQNGKLFSVSYDVEEIIHVEFKPL